jgi:mono/diheme cytochrome c family protein
VSRRLVSAAGVGLVGAAVLIAVTAVGARGQQGAPRAPAPPPPPAPAGDAVAGQRAFATVARVLQSPRCQNCHPIGDRPLQGDTGRPHRFLISRRSVLAGLECSTCHQERNSEALGIAGGPPGAPHWGLPPATTPMVFQGRTPRALCEQLKDPVATGGRDLAALLHHVAEDPLVLWAWKPGGTRKTPPVSHDVFVAAFRTWADSGGACP